MHPTRPLLAAMILTAVAACAPASAATEHGGGCDSGPFAELTRSPKQCVTPDDPTAVDETCNGPGGITIPGTDDDGIVYRIDGGHVPAGFLALPPGDYTVTASPGQQYRFPKQFDATWTLTVSPGECAPSTSTTVPETTVPATTTTVAETTTSTPSSTSAPPATTTTVAPLSPAPPAAPPAAPIVAVPRTTG